ncbi:MAG: hypothetical protein HKN47_15775, partial [Pirellulaceae bacterium]|nr:hypothetical protein [Pirellulaceae bacterium]
MTTFFKIECPKCNKSLKVNENLAGKSRACPYCRATVRIPEATPQESSGGFPNIQVAESGATAGAKPKPTVTPAAGPSIAVSPAAPAAAPRRKVIRRKRVKKSWFAASGSDSASSDVSLVLSGLIGLG